MTKEFLREWVVEGTDCKDKREYLMFEMLST